jgi:hypothetical protein
MTKKKVSKQLTSCNNLLLFPCINDIATLLFEYCYILVDWGLPEKYTLAYLFGVSEKVSKHWQQSTVSDLKAILLKNKSKFVFFFLQSILA